jgi:hypothetical protein
MILLVHLSTMYMQYTALSKFEILTHGQKEPLSRSGKNEECDTAVLAHGA